MHRHKNQLECEQNSYETRKKNIRFQPEQTSCGGLYAIPRNMLCCTVPSSTTTPSTIMIDTCDSSVCHRENPCGPVKNKRVNHNSTDCERKFVVNCPGKLVQKLIF